MDSSKIGVGEAIAGISGLALFVFMFLPWYGIDAVGGFGVSGLGGDVSAWEAFSFIDILLFLVSVIVVGLAIAALLESTPELPQPPGRITAIAGGVALVLIVFRILFTPGVDTGSFEIDVDLGRKFGIFLGLIAAGGITYGGWRAMQEQATAAPAAPAASAPPPPPPAPAASAAPAPAQTTPIAEPPPVQEPPAPPTAPPPPAAPEPPAAPRQGERPSGDQPPPPQQ